MKFSIKDFFSKCDQIRSCQRIWSYLLKKSLMENFIFCAVQAPQILRLSRIFIAYFEYCAYLPLTVRSSLKTFLLTVLEDTFTSFCNLFKEITSIITLF